MCNYLSLKYFSLFPSIVQMNAGIVGKYGEWFTFATQWTYDAEDLGLLDEIIGNIFFLENTEPGTTISMDEFVFELPSTRSYPVADDACRELVVNGDAENTDGNGWHYYPMYSPRSDWWQPAIVKETLADGRVNKFYRASKRISSWESPRFQMIKDCFIRGLVYKISVKVRIFYDKPIKYYIQLNGLKSDGSGWTQKQPLYCPEQTEAQGWVTCSGPLLIDADYENFKEIHYEMKFQNEENKFAVVDFDDFSIAFVNGVSGRVWRFAFGPMEL